MRLFLVCDIDNTLVPFKHVPGRLGLKKHLDSMPSLAPAARIEINNFVSSCFDNLLARARGTPYDEKIAALVEELTFLVENHGNSDVHWSRELWIYGAEEVSQSPLSAQFSIDAAEAYWREIGKCTSLYDDVYDFFESDWWRNNAWELVLVTSSDARLRVAKDGRRLLYDPVHSDLRKRERIPSYLRAVSKANIFVGDPIGKPDPEFWKMVSDNIFYNPGEDIAVMIGDSAIVDLTNLPEGFVPILIDRSEERRGREVKEAKYIIHGFDALPIILENLEKQEREGR